MPTKPKYEYDIEKIESLQNEGLSIRAIARKFGWQEDSTQQWINRNYKKVVKVKYELLCPEIKVTGHREE